MRPSTGDLAGEIGGRRDADTLSHQAGKVANVVGHDNTDASLTGDFCDVRVIDSPADDPLFGHRAEEETVLLHRELMHGEPSEQFFVDETPRVPRMQTELLRESGGHRVEFQAAVPGGVNAAKLAVGHGRHEVLGRDGGRT